jgi:RNA polymerase sigma factor (sigma-70 family)
MLRPTDEHRFQEILLPHLDSAFNLARWLLRNRADVEDVVVDALSCAFRSFNGQDETNTKARLLHVVRNCCYNWLQTHPSIDLMSAVDKEQPQFQNSPVETYSRERRNLIAKLESLPTQQLEMLVLREFERCSYKEIAEITENPVGTVVSTLSRARAQLLEAANVAT